MKLTHLSAVTIKVSPRQPRGGAQAGVLTIIISVLALSLTFGLLMYHHFKPKVTQQKASEKVLEKHTSDKNLSSEEVDLTKEVLLSEKQKQLIEEEQKRREVEQLALLKEKQELEKKHRIDDLLGSMQKSIAGRKWAEAEASMRELSDEGYSLPELARTSDVITHSKWLEHDDLRQVDEIMRKAVLLDTGEYSPEAVKVLQGALDIFPDYEPALTLRNKIKAYPYSLKVPEEVATIQEAAAKLRQGDTLILGKGKHKLTAVLNKGIKIIGQGEKLTSIQCYTQKGAALSLLGKDQIYQLSALSIEGLSYEDDALERHPLILVKAKVIMQNVTVKNSSGHGVAVAGGALEMSKCKVMGNAWDGVSVTGADSSATIEDSELVKNYEHGLDFWDGASGVVTNLKINDNIGSGVVIMGKGTKVLLQQVQTMRNRHCGVLINSQAEATLKRVFSSHNLLSGIVIQDQGTKVTCGITVSNNNSEAGFLIAPSANIENFIAATSEGNTGGNVIKEER